MELTRHEPPPVPEPESPGQAAGRVLSGLKRWHRERTSRQQADDLRAEPPPSLDETTLERPQDSTYRQPERPEPADPAAQQTDEASHVPTTEDETPSTRPAGGLPTSGRRQRPHPTLDRRVAAGRVPKADRNPQPEGVAQRTRADTTDQPARLTDELKAPLAILMILAAIVAVVGGMIHNSFLGLGGGLMSGAALVGFIIVGLTP